MLTRREVLCLGLAAALPACSAPTGAAPDALAIVVGGRSNSAPAGLVEDVVRIVLDALARDTACTIVSADGRPAVVDAFRLRSTAQNTLTVQREQRVTLDRVGSAIDGVRAAVAEVDQLAALTLAARAVAGAPGLRRVVMLDSGVQTAGAMRFQDGGVLDAVAPELADRLADDRALPDLRRVEVCLVGIGDVLAPQEPIGEPGRQSLLAIWSELLTRAGGVVDVVETPVPTRAVPTGLPPVTVMAVAVAPPPGSALTEPVRLGDSAVGFLPDSADLRDLLAAQAVLAPYVDALRGSRQRVRLTGTTSSAGAADGRIALSLARAEVVRGILVSGGIDAATIEVRGLGDSFPGFVPDRDARGRLDPVLAARNRQVFIEPLGELGAPDVVR